jgi:hypothetical protein
VTPPRLPTLAMLLAAAAVLPAQAVAQAVPEDPSVLPEGPGRDEVFGLCTACHSSRLVRNQSLSRERWDETLSWMTERHGMPPLEGEARALFLDYLTAHFGPSGGGGGAPSRAPFLTPPARRNPFAPG